MPFTNRPPSFLVCSGLSHESHRRDVEQVYLRCSQGSLEWLYPTGAVIVNLRPNMPQAHAAGLRVCIRPRANSQVQQRNVVLAKILSVKLNTSSSPVAVLYLLCSRRYDRRATSIESMVVVLVALARLIIPSCLFPLLPLGENSGRIFSPPHFHCCSCAKEQHSMASRSVVVLLLLCNALQL